MKTKHNKSFGALVAGFLIVTGTYNAVVINSESRIDGSDIRFVKRLDELHGVTKPGRLVAASIQWQKLAPAQVAMIPKKDIIQTVSYKEAAPSNDVASATEAPTEAAVKEDLNLSLTEVVNPKKWQQGLTTAQFNGSLSTREGTIESLSVALPNGEGVSVSFSEMSGNVFEYDLDGEVYSGMMYQVDQLTYMVTLTNGPLEGTRLRFAGQPNVEQEQAQEAVADAAEISRDANQDMYDGQVQEPTESAQADMDYQKQGLELQAQAQAEMGQGV